jgi:undecaprenyl-diphosphatase
LVVVVVELEGQAVAGKAAEIAVGFVAAFFASALVVKPFLAVISRSGFAPFAWYRIAFGAAILIALAAGMA